MRKGRRIALVSVILVSACVFPGGCTVTRETVRPPAAESGEEGTPAPTETVSFGIRKEPLDIPRPLPPFAESDEVAGRWLKIIEVPASPASTGPEAVPPATP